MGGIAGIFHPATPKPVDPARIAAMIAAQSHRGPDGEGIWTAPGVGLGHRRLAIVDPAGSVQPMRSGALTVSFDGEIHNFAALRTELEAKGAQFATAGDTEVLLHGWRAWGPDLLDRLDGMFAFALHDADRAMLFLARDRLGVKPLHYVALADGSVAIASELKGLLAHPLLRRVPDVTAIEDYLAYGYVPDDNCLIAGVRKLAAGHFLLIERGKPVPAQRRWWDVSFADRVSGSPATLGEELRERMRRAVRSRMVADVSLGALLSDGIDSAAVVALMAESSPKAVPTATIGGSDARHVASEIATRFATDHRDRLADDGDPVAMDALAAMFDEPFADVGALATFQVCALAKERVTVALTGDGGDEIFAGHRRYKTYRAEERVRGLIPPDLRRKMFGTLGTWAPTMVRAKARLLALADDDGEAYAQAAAVTSAALRTRLFTPQARAALQGHRAEDRYIAAMRDAPARDPLDRAQYADLTIRLPGDTLTRIDRASMAVGLEMREPMLDHRLVEFAATLPLSMRLRGGGGKWLMRRSLAPYLPREILHRRPGTVVSPVGGWFRGALADDAAALPRSRMLSETGWFDMPALARLAEDHRAGTADHGSTLWQFMMLDRSLRHLFG